MNNDGARLSDILGHLKKPFDPTKPVQTCCGLPARIVCRNRMEDTFPIVALVNDSGTEVVYTYTIEGSRNYKVPSLYDLINIPEPEVWVNAYSYKGQAPQPGFGMYSSKDKAIQGYIDGQLTIDDGWRWLGAFRNNELPKE